VMYSERGPHRTPVTDDTFVARPRLPLLRIADVTVSGDVRRIDKGAKTV